jgi:hypothetical protein
MALLSRIYTQPTYNINQVNGWKTRLLYTYYGDFANTSDTGQYLEKGKVDYALYASNNGFPNYDIDMFEVIGVTQDTILNNTVSYIVKGGTKQTTTNQLNFPSDYWKTGKAVRIKGAFFVPGASDGNSLNMRLRIQNVDTNTDYDLAYTNNNAAGGQNHIMTFKTESYESNGPYVNFEYTYSSVTVCGNDVDDQNIQYLKADGYFQYDNGNVTNLYNDEVRFVPVYDSNYYYDITGGNSPNATRIMIDFFKTSVPSILLSYITVEELQ